jgi:serine/threonine protein kinase/Tfp pilus assembly protein PilF
MVISANDRAFLTAEEWGQVKDIFQAALELSELDRQEFLRKGAGENSQILTVVADLLRNHEDMVEASSRLRVPMVPALRTGELIAGRFRIVRFIAAGGMGEVYEARDERLNIRLALKTLRPALLDDTDALERFRREIIIARSASHENLCRVFDLIEHDSTRCGEGSAIVPCLTMELLEGENLAELIRTARPLQVADALPLVLQIAQGLCILHEQGVVHRDLKPSNVMLVPRRSGGLRAVVMDFGLAKRQNAEGDFFESHTNLQAGAPYFMAPELLRNCKPSIASDIYSLGLVMDELVTSTRAFSSSSLQDLYFAKLWESPIRPELRSTGLPEHWAHIILRCLETDPNSRYASVRALIADLEAEVAPAIPSLLVPLSRDGRKHSISRRAMILGGLSVPVVAGTAALTAMAFEHIQTTVEVCDIDNLTPTKDYDYFCKGMTNELMRSLLHLDEVRVFPVYTTRANAPAKRLGRFTLDGLLEAQNGRIRLSMRLTDNQDGRLVWSDTYDRQAVSSPIEVESDIAHGAVLALEQHILSRGSATSSRGMLALAVMPLRRYFSIQTSASLPGPPTHNNAALDFYLRGHSLLEEVSPETIQQAAGYFRRAIEEDPEFALAYAAMADALISSLNYDLQPNPDTLKSAASYAQEAVRRGPTLAEAHMVQGAVRQIDWDWPGADNSFREALRLKPNLSRARRWYAGLVLQFKRFDEAVDESKRALEQDPYDRSGPPSLGFILTMARRFAEAESVMVNALTSHDQVMTRLNLAPVYAWLGKTSAGTTSTGYFEAAINQVNAALRLLRKNPSDRPHLPVTDAMFGLFHTMMDENAKAQPFIEKSLAAMRAGQLSSVMVARIYAAQGNAAAAVDLLNRAASWHDRRLLYVHIDPYFDSLDGNAGLRDLLNRMKL